MDSLRLSKMIILCLLVLVLAGTGYGAYLYYGHLRSQTQGNLESRRKQLTEKIFQRLQSGWKLGLESIMRDAVRLVPTSGERISKGLKLLEETRSEVRRAFFINEETIYLPEWKKFRLSKRAETVSLGISENPDFKLAEILEYQQQNFAKAVGVYEKFWLENPDDFQAANALARCLFKLGAYDRAEKTYRQILAQNPPIEMQDEVPLGLTAAFQLLNIYTMQSQFVKLKALAIQVYTDLADEKWELTKGKTDFFKKKILTILEPYRDDPDFYKRYRALLARDRLLEKDKEYVRLLSSKVIPFIEGSQITNYQVYFPSGRDRFLLITPHGSGHLVLELDYPECIRKFVVEPARTLGQDYNCGIVLNGAGWSWVAAPLPADGWREAAGLTPAFPDLRVELGLPPVVEKLVAQRSQRLRRMFSAGYALFCLLVGMVLVVLWKQMQFAELKSDFVSHVSHELKTPLTSLRMFSEMLLTNPQLPIAKRQQYYNIMNEESIRLSRLIEDLLDISRIERRKSQFHFRFESLDAVIRDALDVFRSSLGPEADRLSQDLTARVEIWMDRDAIIQVLLNLLDNARKYSPPDSPISVRSWAEDHRVFISVHDRGIGMSPSEVRKVFRKFYQVKKSYEEKFKGVGLGLAIVKNIIHHHQGRITMQSEKGRGTTAILALPINTFRRGSHADHSHC